MSADKNILLIQDNPIIAKDLKNMLKEGGYDVLIYSGKSGKSTKDDLKIFPDLVIIDIPEGQLNNSIDLVNRIRKIHYCPVIYLILEFDKKFINEYIKPKLDGYIIKPISRQHLLDAAKRVLEVNNQYRKSQH